MTSCSRHPGAVATWSVRLRDGRAWRAGDPYPVHPPIPEVGAVDLCGPCAAQAVERNWASSLTDLAAIRKPLEPAQ